MTKEEKELLLKDLCARLLYGVKCDYEGSVLEIDRIDVTNEEVYGNLIAWYDAWSVEKCRTYLRPMSSMTEEEKEIYKRFCDEDIRQLTYVQEAHPSLKQKTSCHRSIDWLNANHFDYRGLIEKGLAVEAPEGMYRKVKGTEGNGSDCSQLCGCF